MTSCLPACLVSVLVRPPPFCYNYIYRILLSSMGQYLGHVIIKMNRGRRPLPACLVSVVRPPFDFNIQTETRDIGL